jgi:hypothetical protein
MEDKARVEEKGGEGGAGRSKSDIDATMRELAAAAVLVLRFAYVLLCTVRGVGGAHATCDTIRLTLLKLGALVKISARRVRIAFASACPFADVWRLCATRLTNARGSPA